MKAVLQGVNISPVNMEERRELGIKAGDTVRVHQKIVDDKGKSRIQVFEGLVLARKHGSEPGATFTVRKMASGVGVEKIFPLYSPMIDKLEIVKRAKVRRSKLYYIREKVAREVKRQMRRTTMASLATESGVEAAARIAAEEAKAAEEEATRQAKEAEEAEKVKQAEEAAAATSSEAESEPAGESPADAAPEAAADADATEATTDAETTEEDKK
jgi:large subunit ribosomal protein L19